jgi:hypothetical protein
MPFQTYLSERRIAGRPTCREVYQRVCPEKCRRQDRHFRGRKYNRKPYISIFPFLSLLSGLEIKEGEGHGSRRIAFKILFLFQYFIIVKLLKIIFVLALLLNQKSEEIP